MRSWGTGIEFDRTSKLFFGARPIPIQTEFDESQRGMGFSQRLVNLQCLDCRSLRLRDHFPWAWCVVTGGSKQGVCVCQSGVSQCISRIQFNRLAEMFDGFSESGRRPLVQVVASFEIRMESLGVFRVAFP